LISSFKLSSWACMYPYKLKRSTDIFLIPINSLRLALLTILI